MTQEIAQVLTANRLREGDVVYLAEDGGWTTCLASALVVRDKQQEQDSLVAGERAVAALEVIGPYLMKIGLAAEGPLPLSQRERIRASRGPTSGSTLLPRPDTAVLAACAQG